jgi:hypothetical protein
MMVVVVPKFAIGMINPIRIISHSLKIDVLGIIEGLVVGGVFWVDDNRGGWKCCIVRSCWRG